MTEFTDRRIDRGYGGRYGTQQCVKCGATFDSSPQGTTVNCPACRGGASSSTARQPKVNKMAKNPRDLRQHLYEFHRYTPNALDAAEDLKALHAQAHEENRFSEGWTGNPGDTHTHG